MNFTSFETEDDRGFDFMAGETVTHRLLLGYDILGVRRAALVVVHGMTPAGDGSFGGSRPWHSFLSLEFERRMLRGRGTCSNDCNEHSAARGDLDLGLRLEE